LVTKELGPAPPPRRVEISLRVVPVRVRNAQGKSVIINAMLDDGNTRTIVNDWVREALSLPGYHEHVTMAGVHGKRTSQLGRVSRVTLEAMDGSFASTIMVLCVTRDILPHCSAVDWSKVKKHWDHLVDIPIEPLASIEVDMLIGNDQHHLMRSLEEVSGQSDEPAARLTPLGWTIAGPISRQDVEYNRVHRKTVSQACESTSSFISCHFQSHSVLPAPHRNYDEYLTELFRSRCQMEDLDGEDGDSKMSLENRKVIKQLEESITYIRTDDGQKRVQARCLWRIGEPTLPNNRNFALSRMYNWENSPKVRDIELWNVYRDKLLAHEAKGQIVNVTSPNPPDKAFYLPHFGVFRTHPVTKEKVFDRIVFDGRAKFLNKSLNDALHEGPNLANDLLQVLLKFRHYEIAFCSDIKEMFLNIALEPRDQDYHRFLFRPDRDGKIQEYRFTRHAFGNKGSPCVANFVLRYHANKNREKFPLAAAALCDSTLVDDTLVSVQSEEEGKQLVRELQDITADIGFKTHKMASNSKALLDDIDPELRAAQFQFPSTNDEEVQAMMKTLGMMWYANDDVLCFKPLLAKAEKHTMRAYLSVANALYDPEAMTCPFQLGARLILRRCWIKQLTWDEPAPQDIADDWSLWEEQLPHLANIKIPRCLSPSLGDVVKRELHFFCDASKLAFGVVGYYKTVYTSNEVVIRWLVARNRLAPMKPERSIPRLELLAAELGLKIATLVRKALNVKIEDCHFYTDNACVKVWITSDTKALTAYVARRAGKIQDDTIIANWHWVDTSSNPADVASRGCSLEELAADSLWWNGPDFLHQIEPDYPLMSSERPSDEELEVRKNTTLSVFTLTVVDPPPRLVDLQAFDSRSWSFTKRTIARVILFARYWLQRVRSQTKNLPKPVLGPGVMKEAEATLFRLVQLDGYPDEMEYLSQCGRVKHRSSLHKFQPFLDEFGVMKIGGRLKYNSHVPKISREPILLPKHRWTDKLIDCVHGKELYHASGLSQTFNTLRTRYSIQGGRATVRKRIKSCVTCRRLRPKPLVTREGPLPDFRVPSEPDSVIPFEVTAIDCAGPYEVPVGRGHARKKMYLLILTCTMYRCVSIHVMSGMDADTFLLTMTTFIHTFGRPRQIVSDNGSNFRAGCKLWKAMINQIVDDHLRELYPEIDWLFGPACSPFYTGVVERIVQKAKIALNAVLADVNFNEDQLRAAAAIATSIINNHPLTYVSADPREPSALTPNHFIRGKVIRDIAPNWDKLMSLPKRYMHLQATMQQYWQRFISELVPELNRFHTSTRQSASLKPGDVVVMLDEHHRGEWPLAIVKESPVGKDGITRHVVLRHKKSEFVRHPRRLCLLVPRDLELDSKLKNVLKPKET
jgi:hypothetical protein